MSGQKTVFLETPTTIISETNHFEYLKLLPRNVCAVFARMDVHSTAVGCRTATLGPKIVIGTVN